MGCVKTKSKITPQKPGKVLYLSGIAELDKIFEQCEQPVRELQDLKAELDIKTTDLIRSLGAEKNWERKSSIKEIVTMMIVVISAAANGNFESIGLTFIFEAPFISLDNSKLNFYVKRMVKNYVDFITLLNSMPKKLNRIVNKINKYATHANELSKDVARKAHELDFNMNDKLEAIKNCSFNCELILKAPEELSELMRITQETKDKICEAFDEAQEVSNSEMIHIRGTHAHSEGLKYPRAIVERFWPII